MSTSILYHMMGIIGYEYERLILDKDTISFKISKQTKHLKCIDCKSKNVIKKGKKVRRIRGLPLGHYRVIYLDVIIHKLKCKDCGKCKQEEVNILSKPKIHYSKKFEYIVFDLLEFATINDVAKYCKMSWKTIKEIDKRRLKRKISNVKFKEINYMAIDEIYLGKKKKFMTIAIDLESGRVIHVCPGRGKDEIIKFLKKVWRYASNLQAISIDMSGSYSSAIKEIFEEEIDIVFDRFHIVNLINIKIEELRREYHNCLDEKDRKIIKGKRYLLLRNESNLKEKQYIELQELLNLNTPLTTAYILKEDLRTLWDFKSIDMAEEFLDEWIKKAKKTAIQQLKTMASTLENHKEGIFNYFKHKITKGKLIGKGITTGRLEGINNKIKQMLRASYGLRDEEYLKLKILTI